MGRRRDQESIQGFAAVNRDAASTSKELGAMVGRLAGQAELNQPVPRTVSERMRQAEQLLAASGQELDTAHGIYIKAHAVDDDRDRAPRNGSDRVEQNGDVIRNVRDNG